MEYPEDVMKAATEVALDIWKYLQSGGYMGHHQSITPIAAAILAERERCAKVARTMPLLKTSGLVGSEISICEMGQESAYEATADAIMKGTNNGK